MNIAISVHYMEQKGHDDNIVNFKQGISIFVILLEALKVIAATILICWHIYLNKLGITTYQYLVEKEELAKLEKRLYAAEITREQYEDQQRHIMSARSVRSVHKIKKSNVITPISKRRLKEEQIQIISKKTLE